MRRIDITGKRYGRLVVLSYSHSNKGFAIWNCQCDCGNTKIIYGASLKKGLTISCGCYRSEVSKSTATHGEARKTKEYRAWSGMISRCNTKSDHRYNQYGGRGIKVCDRWRHSYENFLADMGRAPSKRHSIDRINVNGDYHPDNCRWSLPIIQSNNTTKNVLIEFKGQRNTIANWARQLSVNYKWLHKQLKYKNRTLNEIFPL
jgi:hypothetical protein